MGICAVILLNCASRSIPRGEAFDSGAVSASWLVIFVEPYRQRADVTEQQRKQEIRASQASWALMKPSIIHNRDQFVAFIRRINWVWSHVIKILIHLDRSPDEGILTLTWLVICCCFYSTRECFGCFSMNFNSSTHCVISWYTAGHTLTKFWS